VKSLYEFGVIAAGILAVLMVMLGGFLYMTAGGNPGGVEKGKNLISGALWGVVLLLSSYVILYTIDPGLTRLDFELGKVAERTSTGGGGGGEVNGEMSQQGIYDAAAKFNLDDAKYHADGDSRRMDPNDGRFDCAEAYYFVAKEMGLDVGGASNPSYLLTHVRATGTSASSFNDLPVGGMIYWHQVGSDPDNPPPGGHLHVGMKCGTNCVIDMASSGGWQQRTYSGYTNGKTLKGRKVEFIMPRSLNI